MPGARNATIGALRVNLGLNSAQYEQGLKQAQSSLGGFASGAEKAMGRTVKNSKALQQAGLNLSRQFTDIGVSLAGGSSPFLVLTQQLPQVADAFAVAKGQGLGFGAVVKGLLGGLAPLAPVLLAGAVAVGVVAAGLGLFGHAVDKETKHATTFGDTWKATVHVIGEAIEKGPIGKALKFLGKAFDTALSAITTGVLGYLDAIVGHFGAAFQLITKNWSRLPEVFGVIIQGAANLVIKGVEALVNGAIGGLNYLLKAAGKETLGLVALPRIKLANAELAKDYDKTAKSISASFRKGREGLFKDIAKQADKEYEARQKAKKGAHDHAKAVDELTDAQKAQADAAKYLAGVQQDLDRQGLTSDQVQVLELQAKAREYLAKSMLNEAAAALRLADAFMHLHDNEKAAADSPGNVNFTAGPGDLPQEGQFSANTDRFAGFGEKLQIAADSITTIVQSLDSKTADKIAAGFQHVADAFATGGPIAAAVALIQESLKGIGAAIGGSTGAFISGVGEGGILGGIFGLIGHKKAKKKAKKQAAEEARQAALEEANVAEDLRTEILRLSGDAAAAQAAEEAKLLKTLSPANQALQQQIFDLQHEADAREVAAALVAQQRQLEEELADATADAATSLRLFREDELLALPEAFRPAKAAIYAVVDATKALAAANEDWAAKVAAADHDVADAREALAAAAAAEDDRLRGVIDRLGEIGQKLADFNRELLTGLLSPKAKAAFTLSQFNALAGKTDEASLAALPDAGRALLEAAQATAPNRAALNAVVAKINAQLQLAQGAAKAQVSDAQRQLDALHQQTDVLTGIQAGVLSVAEAMSGLTNALFSQQETLAHQAQATYDLAQQLAASAAAAQAALDVLKAANVPAPANDPGSLGAKVDDLVAMTAAVVVATRGGTAILDDATRGGLAINTVAA